MIGMTVSCLISMTMKVVLFQAKPSKWFGYSLQWLLTFKGQRFILSQNVHT